MAPAGPGQWEPVSEGRRTAHEFVRDQLRGAILRGELAGGTRIVQSEIAAQLKVSTTPVREAMRDLATEGLVTLERNRSGIVRGLNWQDMQDITAIRRSLEPLAVQLAMANLDSASLERAEDLCGHMEQEAAPGRWVELNQQFHGIFHDATNPRLATLLKSLQEASGTYVAQAQHWNPELQQKANADHRALVAAFRAHDEGLALTIQLAHINLPIGA